MKKRLFNIVCIVLVLGIIFNLSQGVSRVVTASAFINKGTILIDPGHGGEDGGAVGVNGVKEKDINLPISLILRDLFENNGYRVIMTREEDCDLANKNLDSVSARKRSDMQKRVEIINGSNADVMLSIHQNHFNESKYSGAQIFYGKEGSKILAEDIQQMIVSKVQPQNNRLAKMNEKIFLLKNSEIPSVIVECGFISNEKESQMLTLEEYQLELANAIYLAVSEHLSAN